MPKKESLIVAYILDGKGGGRKISWDEVAAWTPDQGFLWIHLDFTTRRAQHWLKKESGLDHITIRALLELESRPRSVITHEGLLVILRGVNLNPGQDPEDMVSIRTWIDQNRIITTRKRQLLSISDLRDAIDTSAGPKNPSEFLVMLNDRLINRIGDVIDAVDAQVDMLEQEVLTAESRLLRPKIADVRREAIQIRRYLAPQREALYRLQIEETHFLDADSRLHMREATDRIVRYIEDLDASRDRAAITQEELSSRISEQLDRRMYLLSIVAVIFLPLSFITGLLGINVEGIPGAKYPYAFDIVSGGLLVIGLVLVFVFRRSKWM